MNAAEVVVLVLGLTGASIFLIASWVLWTLHSERRYGALVQVDRGSGRSPPLRSTRWRLSGTPDELRQQRDGTIVPVEWKRRSAPRSGPFLSHRVQVWAYCLLVEETFGRAPAFGVLRYGDGVEFRVPWDRESYRALASLRRSISAPYRGEATPSVGRCRGCAFRHACDARTL
ncbi:MAG: PD-(D/E)XK nuclease family protein [Thermoplasmata archaeon]|nr:PD-(D/E)XK nuclease family protein [Thermoplasmata archaeon]